MAVSARLPLPIVPRRVFDATRGGAGGGASPNAEEAEDARTFSIASSSSGTSARRPGPASPRSAISPTPGPTKCTPSASSRATLRRVAGLQPHARVHRGGAAGLVGGHQHARGEVVGMAAGHLGEQIGGGGATTISAAFARQPDVADLALVVEIGRLGEHAIGGEHADRQRRDELPRRLGHDRAHRRPALAQAADQLQALVGGDAAADDRRDTVLRRNCFTWNITGAGEAALLSDVERAPCRPSLSSRWPRCTSS